MNSLPYNIKSIAGLTLFTKLRNQNINVLDIVAGMVERGAWLNQKKIYSISDIEAAIKAEYGFTLPGNVIDKAMQESSLFKRVHNLEYSFDRTNFNSSTGDSSEQIKKYTGLRDDFIRYAEKYSGTKYEETSKTLLQNSLFRYLLEDDYSDRYSPIVHSYLLSIDNGKNAKQLIQDVTDGLLVYIGLSHECILKSISDYRINGKLVLILDTEILFHLTGYNGTVYQNLAKEFYSIIEKYNQIYYTEKKGRSILLRYLDISKSEIDKMFDIAEAVKGNNDRKYIPHTSAMQYMISDVNAKTASDVAIMRTKFWRELENVYSVKPLDEADIHRGNNDSNKYNVVKKPKKLKQDKNAENFSAGYRYDVITYIDVENIDESRLQEYQEHIERLNCINRLKANRYPTNKIESAGYLLITGKNDVLRKSSDIHRDKNMKRCGFNLALSMPDVTREFWLRVNPQFKADLNLLNLDVIARTQRIVAHENAKGITEAYHELHEAYKNKTLSEDELALRYAAVKSVGTRPENIKSPEDMFDASAMASRSADILKELEALRREKEKEEQDKQDHDSACKQAEEYNVKANEQYNKEFSEWQDRISDFVKQKEKKIWFRIGGWIAALTIVLIAAYFGVTTDEWYTKAIAVFSAIIVALFTLKSDTGFKHCMRYLCSGKYRDAVSAYFEKEYIDQYSEPELHTKTPEDCIREMQQRASRQE